MLYIWDAWYVHILRIVFAWRDLLFAVFSSGVAASSNTGGIVVPAGPLMRLLSVMAAGCRL